MLLAGVVVLNFLLIRLAPGDPALVIAGEMGGTSPEILAEIRTEFGLDKSLPEQLGIYLLATAQGDFGKSYFFNQPVVALIGSRLLPTILLVISAQLLSIALGVFLGVMAARRPHGILSWLVAIVSTVGYAAPVFWTGLMLVVLFASVWPIFPVEGMTSARFRGGGIDYLLDVLHHLVLPAASLALIFLVQYARLARTAMIDVLGSDYVRTARAKGVPEYLVVFKHGLRNGILPIITVAGLQFGNLVSGALLIETVFNWPGMGRLAFDSILRRDYPVLLGILFFSAIMVIVANLLTDLSYRLADPRIGARR